MVWAYLTAIVLLQLVFSTKSQQQVLDEGRTISAWSNGLIVPGTRWCGASNNAANYNDLGYLSAADACCRQHDQCPYTIAPGQTRDNTYNHMRYTMSHCSCDSDFTRCLANNGDVSSSIIGVAFDYVVPYCYEELGGSRDYQGAIKNRIVKRPVVFPRRSQG